MSALRQRSDWCAFLWQETNGVVAGVVNSCRWNFHLCSGLRCRAIVGQLVKTCCVKSNAVDGERRVVAINQVNKNLALLQHLVARSGSHSFDDIGQTLGVSAGGTRVKSHDDDKEANSHSSADYEGFLIKRAFHGAILADFCAESPLRGIHGRFYGS